MSGATNTDPNLVSISCNGQKLSGWQNVNLIRGIERFPSSFTITLTEKFPNQANLISIEPGDPIVITFGSDTALTGYVDRYEATFAPGNHSVTISGRSLCEDLVECSAKFQTFQINNTTLVGLATQLAKPFGIEVNAPDGDSATIPQFSVMLTETPYEIIERVARWAAFLVFDDEDGELTIETLGDQTMASGFQEGMNVQNASVSYSADQLYSEIDPVYMSTSFLTDGGPGSTVSIPYIPGAQALYSGFPKRADGQARYRPLLVVSEQTQNAPDLAARKAQWEMARRVGRSQAVRLTCDSWRDEDGMLWEPNALAPVQLPSLKLTGVTWLIAEVTYMRNEAGTTAEIVLMPPEAFTPQPEVLQPFDWQVGQDLPAQGGASATAPNNSAGTPATDTAFG